MRAFASSSEACRRQKNRTHAKSWGELKAEIEAIGPDAARIRVAFDDAFRDYLLAHAGLLEAADGRSRPELDAETVTLLLQGGFQVVREKDGAGQGLAPEDDIDAAAASGDWSGMLDTALDGMTWQIGHGYRPDLRGFDYEPRMAERIAESEKWLRSIEEQAETDSDQEESFGFGEAA